MGRGGIGYMWLRIEACWWAFVHMVIYILGSQKVGRMADN